MIIIRLPYELGVTNKITQLTFLPRATKRSVVALSYIHGITLTQHCKDAKKNEAKAYRSQAKSLHSHELMIHIKDGKLSSGIAISV